MSDSHVPMERSADHVGSGRTADVVVHGSNVIKLFRGVNGRQQALREASVLSALEGEALSLPKVFSVGQFEGRWGIEISRAPASTHALGGEELASWLARIHWTMHQVRPKRLDSLRQKLARNIDVSTGLTPEEKRKLIVRLDACPEGDRLCHGDFHPGNIMGSEHEPFIIDWLDATTGCAEADACRTYLLALHNAPALASAYLNAYLAVSGYAVGQILHWLPVVGAARLSEGVAEETERLLALARAVD